MRTVCTFLLSVIFSAPALAQNLAIQQDNGKLYLNHTVAAKENWYSIGRIYNISPKEIAPFNNTSLDKGLAIGQKLKIPLTATNFAQSGQPGADEAFVPITHLVKEKEGLYRIGQNYNKVPVEELKAWNKLRSDELSSGTNLIVGYLRVKKDLSPLAATGYSNIPAAGVTKSPAVTTVPANTTPVQEKKTTPTQQVPAQEPQKTVTNPPANPTPANPPVSGTSQQAAPGTEGAFAGLYEEQARGKQHTQMTGQAAVFKSTSGWKDGKYYVLMNKATPGTIVKITLPSNGKVVYAKVLGEIPPGKENDGLLIRISNAATAQLQAPEGRFDVQLQY